MATAPSAVDPSSPTALRPILREARVLAFRQPGAAVAYRAGLAAAARGDVHVACSELQKAVALQPDFVDGWGALGMLHEAAEEFARAHLPALATHEEWPEGAASRRRAPARRGLPPTPADAWYDMAVMYRRHGDDERAAAAFEDALRFDPEHAKAWYGLALLHHRHRRLVEAKNAFHELVRLKPDLAPVWRQVGALYCELGQADEAMLAYKRALKISPNSVDSLCGLARAAALAGDTATFDVVRRTFKTADPRILERLERWLESAPEGGQGAHVPETKPCRDATATGRSV